MKKVEIIPKPNEQLEEETISKSKKDEKNPPFKCSPFCALKKKNKSILKTCIPHMFSVSVKVRSVSVQTSSQCLKCPPCLKDILEKSKENDELKDTSPKTSVEKPHASFEDNKSIASSKKETDSRRDVPEVKNEEFSEKSSLVELLPDSNEVEEKENIADELKAPTSDTNLSMTKALESRGVSEVSLCEDCPPCSRGAQKLTKQTSGESDSISTQTSLSLLSNNTPYDVKTQLDDKKYKMTKKSSRKDSNLSVQINDNISARSIPSGTESNISKQMNDEMPRKSNPSDSHISMQPKDIDMNKNDVSEKQDGRISERSSHVSYIKAYSGLDESLNEKPSGKLDDTSIVEKNGAVKTISRTSSCEDCPPCFPEVKIAERKYSGEWERTALANKQFSPDDGEIGAEESSTSMVIETYANSEKDEKGRRKIGTIAISVRVNYPPCSNDVNNNIPQKTSDQLKNIFSEIGELIAEPNTSKIETEERRNQENTGDKEDISCIQYTRKPDIAEDRQDELSGKLQSISEEVMHTEMVSTNGDSEGEFSPASSIFETKIKKTSIELKYMASRTKKLSRIISSNEDVLQIRRSANRKNFPDNDFHPKREFNINRTGRVHGKSVSSSSKIDTSIPMNNNPDNQFKEERTLMNTKYSSVYYLTNKENFIPRKLSNKSHNSSAEVIEPVLMDNNSNSELNEVTSEMLNEEIKKILNSKTRKSSQHESNIEIIKLRKLSTKSRSSSSEIRSSSLRLKSSDSLFEAKKGTPSYQDKIKTRRLSNKSQGSTAEIKTPTTLNNTQRDKSKEENVKITADRNISRSESTDYRSNGEIIKARELSRKLQASTAKVETPTTLNNDPHDKSKEEQVEITTDRNIKQSESINYKSKGENIKARKSSNESRRMSAEIDSTKPTEKIWGSKTNKDQAEFPNGIENSTAHDQLNEVEGTARRASSELRNMSENVNTALATEKIDNLDEKSQHSSPADELVSREAIDENTSDKLKLDSTEAVTPVSPKINSNDQLRNLETEIPTIEKERYSIVSEASHAHEVEDVQDSIATNIQESSSQDFRLVSQTKLDEAKIQGASAVGHQPHSVDRDDIEEQQSYINKEINSPKPSNLPDHEQLEENEIQKSDMEKRDNPPCINCKPFSTDIKIIVKQIPGKQKSISSEFSESLTEVMQNEDSKRSENFICVDCPPCSNLVKALPYQYPNELNDLFSEPTIVKSSTKQELNMSKKPPNVKQSTSKETNGSTSANDHGVIINNEKSSIIDSPAYLNEQKIKGKQSIDHTSLSVNFSLGAKSNGDETEKEKHSENSLSTDYLPISEQSKAMPEKVSETSTESTASLPSDISTIGQFQEKKFNKVACIDCPACSHIIENVPKTSPDEQSPDSSKTSGLLPFSSSGQSHRYDTEKLNTDSNENSFCVDCPPCLNEAENVSRYSAGLSSELFSESQFSNIVASIQAKHNKKHSLRTETSRSVSSEEYSQDESVVIPKQESQPSRNISEVTNNDSFSPSNSGKQEVINQKSIGNLFADLPHQDERNNIEKNRSKASTDYDIETSEDSFCINCPPCSNEVEIPKFMSNGSSNVRSKSSEAESYLKKKILSKSQTISDATSSTTDEKESAGKRSEVPPIGDYLAPSDAMLVTIKSKTEPKGIEIDIMKTYDEKNSKSDVHSCRSNEVKKLVISIIDSCTSKMFPSEATSVAVVLDSKTNDRDVDEENVMSNECIDFYLNLITERFKKKAMDVDDDEFERMFEELTRELNTLFCECGKINPDIFEKSLSYIQSDNDVDKKGNEETATNYIKEENLKQMFNEMKIYLEDKLCSCKSKDMNAVTANAESRTSKQEASPIETEGREKETMKNKIDVVIDVQLNNPPQNISKEKIAQSNLFNDHDETEANKNDDDEPIDNENSDEQEISKSRDEILQNQQEVTESEDMILKSQRGSSIINENATTLSQTLNDEIDDENKLRTNSDRDHSEDGAMKEERGIASRNSGLSEQDNLERFTKKETFESQAKRSITGEYAVKDSTFERKDGDSMKDLNYSMDEDVMKNEHESNRANENENFETVDKKETFITNAKPSVTHKKISDTENGMTRSIDTQETNYAVNSEMSADQKIHKNIHIDGDLPENNSSTEQVSNDTRKFKTNVLPIVFYDKMKIAVDKKKSDNDRKNEPPQTVSFNKLRSHEYQKEQLEGQKTAIANKNDDIRGLERLQWKDDDDDFHSATTCSEVYEHEETYLTLFDKVAMNPMTISDLFPRQLQLADQSGNSSNQESFFTAECPYFYEVSKFSTVYAQRMIPPPDQNNCCLEKQVENYEYTAKSSTYQDGRIFRIEPDGRQLAEVAIKREREDPNENVDKIKVRIRLTDERSSKKPKPSVGSTRTGTDMTIDRSQKFSRSSADFNVKYKAIKEKIVDETKVITEGDKIKILIPLDSTNFQNENN